MAKIPRIYQSIFGALAPASGIGAIGKFGSLAAGSPAVSTDLTIIQSLPAWARGWLNAVIGNNSPPIEDMNAVAFVLTTQLAYLFQAGVSEWDPTTPYYIGSLVNSGGVMYVSLTDNNVDNLITDTANWAVLGRRVRTVSASGSATLADDYIRVDASSGPVTITLPAIATALNKQIKVKKIDTSANAVTVKGSGTDLIDQSNTYALGLVGDVLDVRGATAIWDIVDAYGVPIVGTSRLADGAVTRPKLVAVGQQMSATSGVFDTSSGTFVQVTNLSVTITTTGRPVVVSLQSDTIIHEDCYLQQTVANKHGYIRYVRDSATVGVSRFGDQEIPPSAYTFLDTPPAGAHVYQCQLRDNDGTGVARLSNAVLVVREL